MPHRLFATLTIAVLALCAATASAAPAAGTPTITRGHSLVIKLKTTSFTICTPIVQYSDGTMQNGTAKKAHAGGRLTWALLIPRTAPTGAGTWSVRCGFKTAIKGKFVVAGVKVTTPPAEAPRVVADKQGFSQRSDRFGSGSTFSYGMFLRNTSGTQDAVNVFVLVNMVAASGELIGSATRTVTLIGAGQTYALGDSMSLRTQMPVARLELTIRLGAHQLKQPHNLPEFANVRIVPSQGEPGWVGEVDGEVLNSTPAMTLTNAKLSIVLLDAAGNPVGGGIGYTFSPLPSGSRMVFIASSGFTAVPLDRALTPVVSAEPTYAAAG
ncbi:MAG: hypothetical protein QOF43_2377 [Gaiellaceae bacterium]|nr:hypothetical protein [Gaiellaceae bacterium]